MCVCAYFNSPTEPGRLSVCLRVSVPVLVFCVSDSFCLCVLVSDFVFLCLSHRAFVTKLVFACFCVCLCVCVFLFLRVCVCVWTWEKFCSFSSDFG